MSDDICVPESEDVSLGKIESELARRLKMSQEPGESPVHRARMSNLIVYCDSPERSEEVEALLPAIVRVHPARVLKLVGDDRSGSSEVRASVLVRKAGHEVQLCSEQVTLHGGSHSREHLPFAVRSLLIGDLPTNVWWASKTPPPLAGPILDDLAEYAQQVVYDSLGWADPHRGVSATAPWLSRFERGSADGRWRVASDLNWRRLKYWRRIIAQALAPAGAPGALDSVTDISVEHGPHAVTLAWQLVGWMSSRLGWTIQASKIKLGHEIDFQIQGPHGSLHLGIDRLPDGPSEIRRVNVACAIGGRLGTLNFVSEAGGARLSVVPEGIDAAPRTITTPPLDVADMLGRQLSDREPDHTFRETMKAAQVLARGVIGR